MAKRKTDFKSPKKGSNILCRVSNPTPEMVVRYVQRLPKEEMPEDKFRTIMGKAFFQNEHQAPEQWGLYYIDGTTYYPRFKRDITAKEAERYLKGWLKRLVVINPYTKFKVANDNGIVLSIVKHLEDHPNEHDLKTIMGDILATDESFIVNDILVNSLNMYSEVLKVSSIDKDNELFDVQLLPNYKETIKNKYMTKQEYFHLFDGIVREDNYGPTEQKIYYGCPGTGKSRKVKDKTEGKHGESIVYFDSDGKKIDDIESYTDRSKVTTNIFRTTFHPDYDYSTFVGSYKPVMNPVLGEDGSKTEKEELAYEFVPQVFTNAYVRAYKSLADDTLSSVEKQVYLIIEEINRGNCAQIFGDLFQLLDRKGGWSEFSIIPDAELRKFLEKEGLESNRLLLPSNLHIYATMNTSDQSLFPMDSAFKRRWAMEYVPINLEQEKAREFTYKVKGEDYSWVEFLGKVNPLIRKATDSEDKQMGEFFIKDHATEEEFLNKVMFYIWNDVCKDLYSASRISPLYFMRSAEGDERKDVFTFAELFGKGRLNEEDNTYTAPVDLLEGFITKYLGLKALPKTEQE
ncbi:MAG: AAA family ATPase [Bacteroidales bacterium]|nr:AAA family ATPase [Bacteroidales bacterium]